MAKTTKKTQATTTQRHRAALVKQGGRAITAELDAESKAALDVLLKGGETIRTAVCKALQRLAKDRTRPR